MLNGRRLISAIGMVSYWYRISDQERYIECEMNGKVIDRISLGLAANSNLLPNAVMNFAKKEYQKELSRLKSKSVI